MLDSRDLIIVTLNDSLTRAYVLGSCSGERERESILDRSRFIVAKDVAMHMHAAVVSSFTCHFHPINAPLDTLLSTIVCMDFTRWVWAPAAVPVQDEE